MDDYRQIHIQRLATSNIEERFLLICKGRYYEVSRAIIELILCLQKEDTMEKAITIYTGKMNNVFSYEEIEELIVKCIIPMFNPNITTPQKTFIYERELFTASSIDYFSNACSFLFHRKYMLTFIVIVTILDIYFFHTAENLLNFNNSANAYNIIGLLFFIIASSLFHELGHASACKFFNIHHGGIGFGLYLNFPVLYTNVTEIWRLNRKQRCIVNIAGVYFQMYALFLLLVLYILTKHDIVRYMILVMNLGFLITLNPFFKFDGYWIASDILGIPNLRLRSKELLINLFKYIKKNPSARKPYLLQVNKFERYGLLIYSIIINLFMGYYFFYIIPKFTISFINSFPNEIHQLVLYLSNDMTPSFALLRNITMQLLLLALIGVFIFNFIRHIPKYISNIQK